MKTKDATPDEWAIAVARIRTKHPRLATLAESGAVRSIDVDGIRIRSPLPQSDKGPIYYSHAMVQHGDGE